MTDAITFPFAAPDEILRALSGGEPAGPAAALKFAGLLFRSYEVSHAAKAGLLETRAGEVRGAGRSAEGVDLARDEALDKARRNGVAAEICELALAAIEGMAATALERRPRAAGPSPAALFREGFLYGGAAMNYDHADETTRDELWPEAPPSTPEDAWAQFRARLTLPDAAGDA
jgi:hypothetical protein